MQLKRHSLLETCLSTLTGFIVSIIIQVLIYPARGYHISMFDNFFITGVFTVASVVRGYVWRRIFNRHTERKVEAADAMVRFCRSPEG